MPKVALQLVTLCFIAVISAASIASIGPKVGQTAPPFTLTDLNDKPHSLESLRKKGPVLLVFWSTKCHICHAMIPRFKEIHEKYSKKGLTLVAVNVGFEDKDEVDDYVFEFKLNYLVLNEDDKKAQIGEDYRLVGTPTIQLVAPDGTVKYRGHRIPDLDKLLSE
ncbi:MAG: TlpA family protein disulfide reductase [Gammaproteobacteria bacterium]|nr:TlpA family protein disulfide reductase [Gammaproteobacteria bacterium]